MDVSSIIMLVILLFLIALMVFGYFKRKKFNEKLLQMRENLKIGDKVMTDTGVFGEIVDKRNDGEYSFVTLKTGAGEHIGYMEVHSNAIYYTFDNMGNPDYAGQNADESTKEDAEK